MATAARIDVGPRTGQAGAAVDPFFAAIFLLALALRLLNIAFLRGHDSFLAEPDALTYWTLGAALAKPAAFWRTLLATTNLMPAYPLLLATVQAIFGDTPRAVAIIQAVIDSATCALIGQLGTLVSPRVGRIAGILAAISITLVVYSSQVLTDTLFLFFFTLMLWTGARFLLAPTTARAFQAGLAGGLALATRPAIAVLLVAATVVVCVATLVQRRTAAQAMAASIVFAIAAAAPISPVLLRNHFLYDSWNLTTQTGEHLAFWIVPLVSEQAAGTPYQATRERIELLYQQRLAERSLRDETNPFRTAAVKVEVAKEQLALLPLSAYVRAWIGGMAINLGAPAVLSDPRVRSLPKPSFYSTSGTNLWDKARAYTVDSPGVYRLVLLVGLGAMLPFLVLEASGFVVLARRRPWPALFTGGIVAYFLLVNGPVASAKYRMPIEPVLIILCAIALDRAIKPKSPGQSPSMKSTEAVIHA